LAGPAAIEVRLNVCFREFEARRAAIDHHAHTAAVRPKPLLLRHLPYFIGAAIVVMLMIFAAYNDISGILHRLVS
jgi:membrane-associated protease RseP (regulator of RpoE activity)